MTTPYLVGNWKMNTTLEEAGQLPTVTLDDKGVPSIEFPDNDAPADLVVKVITYGGVDRVLAAVRVFHDRQRQTEESLAMVSYTGDDDFIEDDIGLDFPDLERVKIEATRALVELARGRANHRLAFGAVVLPAAAATPAIWVPWPSSS